MRKSLHTQSLLFIQSTHFSFVIQGRRNYVEEQGGDTSSTPQSLADTLTIFQSGEADYAHYIYLSPPHPRGFSDFTTTLQVHNREQPT